MKTAVSIVGVGNMGGAIAANLLRQGWPVVACDIDAARVGAMQALGAVIAATPAQAARTCDAVIVCVVDAAQTASVLFDQAGVVQGRRDGQAVVLCPTIAPQDVEQFAQRLAQAGIATVDAPMSGGPARALDGSMSLMVACEDALLARLRPLLDAMSSKVFRISQRAGDGARTKLVNNLLAGINLAGAAEALAMARKMGLDQATTLAVIEQSSGQSWIGTDRMRRAIAGDFAPRAHVTLLQKDTRLAVEAAAAAGFQGPLGPVARDVFAHAVKLGLGSLDDASLLRLLSGQL